MLNDNSTGNTENIGQLYTLFCEKSFTPYSIYKRKITDRLLRVGTTIRMHESFASSPRKYVWAKSAMKRNTTKEKDCVVLQKFFILADCNL
jgi:hypothetical protein